MPGPDDQGRQPEPARAMTAAEGPALSYSSAPGRWVLAVTVLGAGIAALDATVVSIALPIIGRDFRSSVAALQWVMNGYTPTLAAFLLIGGSLGDRFGRRAIYLIGIAWFAVASAACGFAPNVAFLIVTRLLQGAGAALLTPGSLAILEASFRPADRARAIGAWSGLGGIAVAAGPLVGGYLISAASWRWIFFINVPIALVVIALGARHVPESRDPRSAGHPPRCSPWRCSARQDWLSSWPGSATRRRRCCPCPSSPNGSSRRSTPLLSLCTGR